MENNNKDIENKIFLSIKGRKETLSSKEIDKIIKDELTANGYEDWQVDYAIERIKKMIEKENEVPQSIEEKKKEKGSKKIMGISSSVLVGYAIYLLIFKPFVNPLISEFFTQHRINEAVKQVKGSMVLPYQADEVTTAIDITAETNAIRFHYLLANVDLTSITNEYLKSYLITKTCTDEKSKKILNQGINIEYSYTIKDSPQTFLISFAKEDCVNYIPPELHPLSFPELKPIKVESK